MKTMKIKHLVSIVGLTCFLLLLIGSNGEDSEIEQDTASSTSMHTLSAIELYSAYNSNEVAADQKFKDKIITVTGTVENIAKDIMDDIYVTLKGERGEYSIGSIQCFFSKAHTDQAATLKKGQKLTVKGKCTGKMMNVLMRGCIIQ